LVSAEPSRD